MITDDHRGWARLGLSHWHRAESARRRLPGRAIIPGRPAPGRSQGMTPPVTVTQAAVLPVLVTAWVPVRSGLQVNHWHDSPPLKFK